MIVYAVCTFQVVDLAFPCLSVHPTSETRKRLRVTSRGIERRLVTDVRLRTSGW